MRLQSWKRLNPFVFALGVFALGALSGAPSALAEQSNASKAPVVSVMTARKMTFHDNILVTGSLVPREEVLVGPELDGYRIVEVLAEEGDHIAAGQVLAKLSREILEAQVAQNQASVARAEAAIAQAHNQIAETEASLRQAEEAFNRIKPLHTSGVASQATYEEREMAFRTSSARLAAQKQGLRLAEADQVLIKAQSQELQIKLRRTDIMSPTAGIVSRRTARIGAMSMSTGEVLFRLIKDGEIELDAEVPEFYLARLKSGQHAQVDTEGLTAKQGTVRLVATEVNPATRLGHVRIFLGASADLRIGSFAKGMIHAGERDSIAVPSTAVLYQNDTASLLIVQDNVVHERFVKTGLMMGEYVEITQGLRDGEVVVMRAGSLLRNGDAITPQFNDAQTASSEPSKEAGK